MPKEMEKTGKNEIGGIPRARSITEQMGMLRDDHDAEYILIIITSVQITPCTAS